MKMLQKKVEQNQEFAEIKQRETDDKEQKWQSDQNRLLIEKEKKRGKTKKDKKKKATKKSKEPEILDVSEWKIVGRYMDRKGPMFEVHTASTGMGGQDFRGVVDRIQCDGHETRALPHGGRKRALR